MDPPGPNWLGQKYYAMTAGDRGEHLARAPLFAITILAGLMASQGALRSGGGRWRRAGETVLVHHLTLFKPVLGIIILVSTSSRSASSTSLRPTHGGPINSTHLLPHSTQGGSRVGEIGEGRGHPLSTSSPCHVRGVAQFSPCGGSPVTASTEAAALGEHRHPFCSSFPSCCSRSSPSTTWRSHRLRRTARCTIGRRCPS